MIPIAALGLLKNWKLIGIVAGIVLLLLALWAGYVHYQGLILKVEELTKENAKVRMTTEIQSTHLSQQKEALYEWKKSQDQLIQDYRELSKVATAARKETGRLHDLFSKHNFSALAAKKPGLIQNRVNAGTANVFRMLECETGNSAHCVGNRTTGQEAKSPKPGPN